MIVGWNWRKRWEFKLMLNCKHKYNCACSSEIGTCIINDVEKNQQKYTLYTHVLKVNVNFQHNNVLVFFNLNLNEIIPFIHQVEFFYPFAFSWNARKIWSICNRNVTSDGTFLRRKGDSVVGYDRININIFHKYWRKIIPHILRFIMI